MVSHTYFYPKILDDSSVLPRSFHMFRNLVSFEVDIIHYGQIKSLFDIILQFSPNLTSLIFRQLFTYDKVGEDALSLNIVPRCLLFCLKSIEFQNFSGHPGEIEVVNIFLENARVLLLITLGSSSHRLEYMNKKKSTAKEVEDANHKILEQLLPFSWASADCMVTFSSP
ncbi:FBD-associated F-box protein At5g22730-like [Papaver somniferum]|uniref:FBD-associated F-box protein At5g22730-like n=1 Tax=Papaver somniferum TaxID=3469 RepID=UPI000E7047ED|nr:FBD-associated F-box protein At5g22730-like [Papaver somniferum]XP_026408645.1 FBD-associated F-box protein At5g22730-like [Papaver somniferum]